MFEITIPARDHSIILKNLRKIPYMQSESETQHTMKHPSGLVVEYHVHGEKITADVIENPDNVPEETIKARNEDDLKELAKSTQ